MQITERWKQGAQLVFSDSRYRFLAAAFFMVLLPVYALLTDIIVVPSLSLNPPMGLPPAYLNPNLNLPAAFLIISVAALASLGLAIAIFQLSELRSVSKKSAAGAVMGAGGGGSVIATFATSCTICQPIWLVWLGLGGISTVLIDYSLPIALASIALLLFSINSGFKSVVEGCKLKK